MRTMSVLRKLAVSFVVAAITLSIMPYMSVSADTSIPVTLHVATFDDENNFMVPRTTGGQATVDKTVVKPGETVTVTTTINSNYKLDSISFGDGAAIEQESLSKTFTVPLDYSGERLVIDVSFKSKYDIDTYPLEYYSYYSLQLVVYAQMGAKIALEDYSPYWYCPAGMHFEGWTYMDVAVSNEYFPRYQMENGDLYTVKGPAEFHPVFKNWFTGWTDTGDGGVVANTIGDALRGGLGSSNPVLEQVPGDTVSFEFELKEGYVLDNDNKVEIIGSDGQTVIDTIVMSNLSGNYYSASFIMPNEDISFRFKTKSLYKTVTFNSNGGSSVAAQTVDNGGKATKPSDPTKSGYTFDGWYTDSACTKAYDFSSAVTSDITLYAKWTAVSSGSGSEQALPAVTSGIAHVQDIGNVTTYADEETGFLYLGTEGQGKRLESITLYFDNPTSYTGTLEYRVHVQDIGWTDWVTAGNPAGTTGQAKRIEAIEIRLTGELADNYSVFYGVHIQDYGDMQGWVQDGALAGTTGESKRIEALAVVIAPKGMEDNISVQYRVHVQDYGWEKSYASDGQMAGTSGESKRLEGIEMFITGCPYSGGIQYKTHIQDIGWESGWTKNGEMSGTQGQSKRLEGICIELYGEVAEYYDIYYRVHAQDIGWMGWAKNGECAGTAGRSARLEGIQIVLVPKGSPAPGATYEGITAVTEQAFVEGF